MATTLQKQILGRSVDNGCQKLWTMSEQVSEWFWFMFSFLLFVLLGPFSAPVALIAIFKLGLENNDHPEPESIS